MVLKPDEYRATGWWRLVVAPIACLAALWVWLTASLAPAVAQTEAAPQGWIEFQTPNLRAFSNGSTQELLAVVGKLEQFRHYYSSLAGQQSVVCTPIYLFAFKDDRTFTPYKPLYEGKPKSVSGYFTRALEGNFIGLDVGRPDAETMQTIFHEYTHLLLRRNSAFWPLWLEEGMADVYSTFEVSGDQVVIGQPSQRRLRILAQRPMMPLSQLLAVNHESPEYNSTDHQGVYYAQSWLLAHYLSMGDNPSHRARFGQYTQALRKGQPAVAAFTNVFGVSLAVMEKQLQGYLERGKFQPTRLKTPPNKNQRSYWSSRSVPAAEMAFNLGWLLLRVDRANDARRYFEMAARLHPGGYHGPAGLGLLAAESQQSSAAIAQLEQAIKLGSNNYYVHFLLGQLRLADTKDNMESVDRLPAEKARAIREPLQQAITFQPNCAPAHNRLGLLEAIQGESDSLAERHLQAAVNLEPDNFAYTLILARFQIEQGKRDQAKVLLQAVAAQGSHPKFQAQARKMLDMLERTGRVN